MTNTGTWFSELFPALLRGSGAGFAYNIGRGIGAFAPSAVGFAAESTQLGIAMAIFGAGAYALVFLSALMLPETRNQELL